MKNIITTVGTSLLTNALGDNLSNDLNYKRTRGLPFHENKNRTTQIAGIESVLKNYIKSDDTSISAEIDSIIKIANEYKEECDVYLIATDTIQSPICAEFIQKWFDTNKVEFVSTVHFRLSQEFIIQDLQVKQKQAFERNGLTNLFNRINTIAKGVYWDNIVFNITGGYKALIPYMSLMAQINNVPAYYNFQESKDDNFDLLKIPNIPINVDYTLFDKYWDNIEQIAETGDNPNNYQFEKELVSILEKDGNNMMLTSLGYVLWQKYKEKYFIFYCPDDVWEEMNRQKDIMRIIKTKFHSKDLRESKTEKKQEHYVFDDGNNNNRIYYFKTGNKIYIYKTFENEEEAKLFINEKFDNKSIIESSKIRRIEIIN